MGKDRKGPFLALLIQAGLSLLLSGSVLADSSSSSATMMATVHVELEDVPVGDYALLLDGAWLVNITAATAADGTRGKIEFEDEPEAGELLLTFDPTGSTIAIEREGVRYFERTLPTMP